MPGSDGLQLQITGPNFTKFGLLVQVVEVETHVNSVVISGVKLILRDPVLLQQILSTYSAYYTSSQKPTNVVHPQLDKSSPHHLILLLVDLF